VNQFATLPIEDLDIMIMGENEKALPKIERAFIYRF